MADDLPDGNAVELAAELTIAWLGNANTRIAADEVPAFLQRMHDTVTSLLEPAAPQPTNDEQGGYPAAVSARRSLASKDHIVSMIDGKPYKTLRRHLTRHGLTPDEYRERYGLKADYPMVAANYSESRRAMAHKLGLGRKPKGGDAAAPAPAADPAPARAKTPRPRKAAAKAADA